MAEFGTLHMEFVHLTYLTGNPVYYQKVCVFKKRIMHIIFVYASTLSTTLRVLLIMSGNAYS